MCECDDNLVGFELFEEFPGVDLDESADGTDKSEISGEEQGELDLVNSHEW